jgi:hypothetical protein
VKKIAVFGNAGGDKSRVARRLAEITGLPLIVLEILQFPEGYRSDRDGGGKISDEQYSRLHSEIRSTRVGHHGYGSIASAWGRFAVADTVVYVNLPLAMHYWGVTKRLMRRLFKTLSAGPRPRPSGLAITQAATRYLSLFSQVLLAVKRKVGLRSARPCRS